MRLQRYLWLGLLWRGVILPAMADPLPNYKLVLENHLFSPSRLEVPANTKFRLIIENRDKTAEEFDSFDLNREKFIFPNRSSKLYIGPLEPGIFNFFGEFNTSTARGVIVAIPKTTSAIEQGGGNAD